MIDVAQLLVGCGCPLCEPPYPYPYPLPTTRMDPGQAAAEAARQLFALTGSTAEKLYANGYVEVVGSSGGRYRLLSGHHQGNVRLFVFERWVRLCIHLTTAFGCSREENMLAQALMVKTDEPTFRRLAVRD